MAIQEEQSNLVAYFSETTSVVNKLLSEFKKTFKNEDIKKTLPTVEGVYMYAIVMHLGKIFSKSLNEHYSLDKFSSHFPGMKDLVVQIYNNHKDIIGKVKNNRDQLFAHTDKNFHKLGFSEDHVNKLNKTYNTDFLRIKAASKDQERYTPADLHTDLIEIKQMMDKVDNLWHEAINIYFK